jgi:TetR/AcrR family transcriptional regulator, mexJK operon transcriptional repressor
MNANTTASESAGARPPRSTGGRPTKAAAAERDERLLAIATRMFMENGFDATSMDRLADAAAIGKATLYARYADKAALFAAVLQRRILQIYTPLEDELARSAGPDVDLATALKTVATRLAEHAISPDALALSRILAAQGSRFPELGQLAVREGSMRQVRLIETVLMRHKGQLSYRSADLEQAADLFLSIALGRSVRLALFGVTPDLTQVSKRIEAAVDVFLHGVIKPAK